MFKKLVVSFLSFLLVISTLTLGAGATSASAQTKKSAGKNCYCYYVRTKKKPRTATGARLYKIENDITIFQQQIIVLQQIPETQRTPDNSADFTRITKRLDELKAEYDVLEPRVTDLEKDVKDLRTDLNATTARVDEQDVRLTKVENRPDKVGGCGFWCKAGIIAGVVLGVTAIAVAAKKGGGGNNSYITGGNK